MKSVELCENAWAYRNLAQIEKNEYKNIDKAICYMQKAVSQKPDYQPLWVNYAESFFANNDYEKWVDVYENLIPYSLKPNGRLKMLYAFCLVECDRHLEALDILNDNFVLPDIKEGEFSISRIWLGIHKKILEKDGMTNLSDKEIYEKYPLPYKLDFRMH